MYNSDNECMYYIAKEMNRCHCKNDFLICGLWSAPKTKYMSIYQKQSITITLRSCMRLL